MCPYNRYQSQMCIDQAAMLITWKKQMRLSMEFAPYLRLGGVTKSKGPNLHSFSFPQCIILWLAIHYNLVPNIAQYFTPCNSKQGCKFSTNSLNFDFYKVQIAPLLFIFSPFWGLLRFTQFCRICRSFPLINLHLWLLKIWYCLRNKPFCLITFVFLFFFIFHLLI